MEAYVTGYVILIALVILLGIGMTILSERTMKLSRRMHDAEERLDTARQHYYDLSDRLRQTNVKVNALGRAMEMEWHEPPDPPTPAAHWRRKETA